MIRDVLLDDATDHDVCVVGSGPVGLSLAMELAALGKKVLLLESGGSQPDAQVQELSRALIVEPSVHDDMSIAVARRLGGTSNLWGGRCLPYDPIDFAIRPGLVDEALWPIGLDEIKPFYARACEYANCGVPQFTAPLYDIPVQDALFSHESLERWSNKPWFQRAHGPRLQALRAIDIRLNSTLVDIEVNDGTVTAVTIARPDGGRHILPVKKLVIAAGGVESTRLLLTFQRKYPTLFGGVDGALGRHYMGHVIGEIADITFSNEKIDAAYDFFVDAGSYVRRRFVPGSELQKQKELSNIAFWPIVPPVADAAHRSGPLSLIALVLSIGPLGRLVIAEAIRKRHIPDDMSRALHIRNVFADLPRVVSFVPGLLWRRFFSRFRHPGFFVRNPAHRYGLSYHAEHLPNPESRVTLADDTDRFGLPRAKIDLRFDERDALAVVRAHDELGKWLQRNGIGYLEYRQPAEECVKAVLALASHGTHQVGLARMAQTESAGVVNANLCCFGTRNMYVASTAVLPTSGQANPTLTTIALAVRLAKHLSS